MCFWFYLKSYRLVCLSLKIKVMLSRPIQSRLFKCYPYKPYNFIYVKKILLPYKNTHGKISECYVLSVMTCSTPFFVNCTFISVNFEKIRVIIYESIHFNHVITFIPYSLRTIQNCWRHTGVLLVSIEREIEEAGHLVEVDEVATLLHQQRCCHLIVRWVTWCMLMNTSIMRWSLI